MSNKVSYDFSVYNIVAVDAPIGTDPDTLIEQAKQKLIEGIQEGNITFRFENVSDGETGDYSKDWENFLNPF
jgi:hypothetical protein